MYKIETLLLIVLIVSISLLFSCEDTGANPQIPDGENEDSTQDSSQDDSQEETPLEEAVISSFMLTDNALTDNGVIAVSIVDNGAATAWMITTSDTEPAADSVGWLTERPVNFTLETTGVYNLHAWGKNTAGTVSAAAGPISAEYVAGPAVGEIIVTEIMADPTAEDTDREWFETYNTSSDTINLKGCVFTDAGSSSFSIDRNLFISAGDYLVLALSDVETSKLPTVDFIYSGFSLSNSSDSITITSISGTIIDTVASGIATTGTSTQLSAAHLNAADNDIPDNWALSTAVISFENSDLGTPGSANDSI